ncbi:MAG TPA: cation:dicarboxylase symporter family transporter [Candidatus Limnocylindrales bacterium]|nr:cation:dicarboxylase symporter family transporter [Candidatus Limnocylindrales bacterium]
MAMKNPGQNKFLLAFLVLTGLAAVLWALGHYFSASISPAFPFAVRWIALLAFCAYAWTRRSLTVWIFAGMLIGAEIGYDFPHAAAHLQVLSSIFLRLIKTIVAPLIFGTLVVGIAGHANLKQVGRMGIKALLYFEIITTIALFIGLAAINISQAGARVTPPANAAAAQIATQPQKATDVILHIFPENIAKSVAEGQVLQVVVFSIIFGIALALVGESKRQPMLRFCESLSETMFKFTNVVMLLAPVGVGAAIAYTVGTMGFGVMVNLLKLLATLYAALAVFLVCVLLPVILIARVPLRKFIHAVAEPVSIAFATASSEAALPRAMESMEAFGVPRPIVAFVMPTGYSFNLDGSTLYLSLASIFVAQAAGIHLTFGQQLIMVFTLMLTSKGVAGVPRAMLVILLGTVDSFHLPVWPVFVILGVDQLMDMARTATNVLGNCLATAVVARWEGEFGRETSSPAVLDAIAK